MHIHRLRVKRWKKVFQVNRNEKKAGVATLISDKLDLKVKDITRDNEGHFIILKGAIQQEEITLVNIYASNTEHPNTFIKKKKKTCWKTLKERLIAIQS